MTPRGSQKDMDLSLLDGARATKRNAAQVKALLNRAPRVPSSVPNLSVDEAEGVVDKESPRGSTTDAEDVAATTETDEARDESKTLEPQAESRIKESSASAPRTTASAAEQPPEMYANRADSRTLFEPPPPYNMDFALPVTYPDAKDAEAVAPPALIVTEVHSLVDAPASSQKDDQTPASALPRHVSAHRRSHSDYGARKEMSDAPAVPLESANHLGYKGWRQKFTTSRGHASDVEMVSSDDDCASLDDEKQIHTRSLTPQPQKLVTITDDDGPSGPAGGGDGGSGGVPSEPTPTGDVQYPQLQNMPLDRNPLHPRPVSCEVREEWEPGMDPSFSSRAKISSLFTGKGWKETAWKQGWLELFPEDGYKLCLFDVAKTRDPGTGEVVYQKKPTGAILQTYSLRHASVQRQIRRAVLFIIRFAKRLEQGSQRRDRIGDPGSSAREGRKEDMSLI
ncbi:hypothetical protein HKX48_008623 [Thoreauomyces humboldtii]|nr:hypothetical protein HKX48_008623 [Thoreauomyces humboldtii]